MKMPLSTKLLRNDQRYLTVKQKIIITRLLQQAQEIHRNKSYNLTFHKEESS